MSLYGDNGLLTYIKNQLETVNGIGVVYDYERVVLENFDRFISMFRDSNGIINGWYCTRQATEETMDSNYYNYRTHTIKIVGYYQHNDSAESEKTFQELVEAICDKLRETEVYQDFYFNSPASVNTVDTVLLGNILVHHCELSIRVLERKIAV